MTLMRVHESGGDYTLLNLRMVCGVECRGFSGEQEKHRARVFLANGASVVLVGKDADRVTSALEDTIGYPR